MELLVVVVLGLGFFAKVIAAIVYGKDDVARVAAKVYGQIATVLSSGGSE